MPCRGPYDDAELLSRAHGEINRLTKMLCACCKQLEYEGITVPRNTEVWWGQHQEQDRMRLVQEAKDEKRKALVTAAKAKLTPAERKALGI